MRSVDAPAQRQVDGTIFYNPASFNTQCAMDPLEAPDQAEYTRRAFNVGLRTVLAFPEEPYSQTGFKYYTNHELRQLTAKAADHYVSHGLKARRKGDSPLVIGIYAAGTIEWVVTFYALVLTNQNGGEGADPVSDFDGPHGAGPFLQTL